MRSDIQRWDEKYRRRSPQPANPDSLLSKHSGLLTGDGLALDIACGDGHNAVFLAKRGYHVIGLDGSRVGLRACRENARRAGVRVHLAVMDLDDFTPPAAAFDLIVVFLYLNRDLLPRLPLALRPGGLLFYRTFNTRRLAQDPGFRREFLLEDGELAAAFAPLETIAGNDPSPDGPSTHWVGRKPAAIQP